jgi:FkbM family methyltransferase
MKTAYDVGVYDGADTAHYLGLGYRVIGVEASPDLCQKLQQKFDTEIANGSFTLLNIAIGEHDGVLPFYLSENPQWNSFDYAAATRNGYKATQISIPTRRLSEVIAQYGTPDFLKIDIEGADEMALRALGDSCPAYLSFEAWRECENMLLDLASRGYKQFSLIQQRPMRPVVIPPAGTLAHVKWSVRQWTRWQLRQHVALHKIVAGARSTLRWAKLRRQHRKDPASVPMLHATLTPMEHNTWYSLPEFLWLWTNVVRGGQIDSSWFDVHARRA